MMEFAGGIGKSMAESKLSELAKEVPATKQDIKVLDKPLQFGESKISEKNFLNEDTEKNINTNNFPTRNQELEGKEHPETNVPFEKKSVENNNGEIIDVVVPKFDSDFDAQLPSELNEASDKDQFNECNKQLKEKIEKNPEFGSKFSKEQLEQIMDGETPDGYTWHHDAEKGKMQLVDSTVHAKTGHTGGKSIWGGGSEKR
ncbi:MULTISPECIES: HNH endonuclease [unclassified Acetobacterium]|uniref:HNH endonuclease n=1 Tax=unclassified Acetobacterium TaxID=2638182 RepID=UPI0013A70539|nr:MULTISPECIES: HNH endonuclease [unclassified Acetobacterium]MDZ5725938.1 HNH endonuclease [Acetobacterium sp. K1/6]